MSLSFETYMRTDLHDLDLRVAQRLHTSGYRIEFQPITTVRSTPPDETLWVAVLETPKEILRVEPDSPLLLGFGYSVAPRTDENLKYAPRGVRKFSAVAFTRTAAGRSLAAGCMQHLIAAALAAETDGWLMVDGDQNPRRGDRALEMAYKEMLALGTRHIKLDHGSKKFIGWTEDGKPNLNGETIFREDMPSLPFPVPAKKWWQFWR